MRRASGAVLRPPLLSFFAVVGAFVVVEWAAWYCSYSSRIPVLARARQLVFTYAQRHSPTYFDNMLTGKVAHRAMLLPEQTVTLFERTNWDYLPLAVQCGLLLALFFRAQPTFAAILLVWLIVYVAVTTTMGRRIAAFGAAAQRGQGPADRAGSSTRSPTSRTSSSSPRTSARIGSSVIRWPRPSRPSAPSTAPSFRCA